MYLTSCLNSASLALCKMFVKGALEYILQPLCKKNAK